MGKNDSFRGVATLKYDADDKGDKYGMKAAVAMLVEDREVPLDDVAFLTHWQPKDFDTGETFDFKWPAAAFTKGSRWIGSFTPKGDYKGTKKYNFNPFEPVGGVALKPAPDGYKPPQGNGNGGAPAAPAQPASDRRPALTFEAAVAFLQAANEALGVEATPEQATSLFIAFQRGEVGKPADGEAASIAEAMGGRVVHTEEDGEIPW